MDNKVKFLIFIVISLMLFSCGSRNNTKGIDFKLNISNEHSYNPNIKIADKMKKQYQSWKKAVKGVLTK